MDVSLDGSTDGNAGRIEVLEGRSGRRMRSEPVNLAIEHGAFAGASMAGAGGP